MTFRLEDFVISPGETARRNEEALHRTAERNKARWARLCEAAEQQLEERGEPYDTTDVEILADVLLDEELEIEREHLDDSDVV